METKDKIVTLEAVKLLKEKIDSTKATKAEVNEIGDDLGRIESKIPSQASSSNQLADKSFVNSSINSITAFYITKDAQGNPFSTKSELSSASEYYSGGERRDPTRNDYCIVRSDEGNGGSTTRYIYQNGQWEYQYTVNDTPLTSDQLAAINSGITEGLVSQISSNAQDVGTIKSDYLKSSDKRELEGKISEKSDFSGKYSDLSGIPQGIVIDGNYVHTDNNYTNQDKAKLSILENYDDSDLRSRINEIESSKFPNVTIFGQPTINQGQMSGFSASNYAKFPFVVNFQGRPFIIEFDITTGNDVTNQQNVLDSDFGLAFAVRSGRFVIAISTNGTSWDLGEGVGTMAVSANSSYRIKIRWDGSVYKVDVSTNGGESYVTDISKAGTMSPYPKQIFIGVGQSGETVLNSFKGIINLNYAKLTISDKLVWQGMDDVGIATRLAVDVSNIDEAGVQRIKDIVGGSVNILDITINGQSAVDKDTKVANIDLSEYATNNDVAEKVPKDLSILPEASEGYVYVDNNGTASKASLSILKGSSIRTVSSIPEDWKENEYIFLRMES